MSTAQDTRPQPPAWPGAASRAWTLLQRLDIATPRAAYVARSLLAAALALGVAYLLELESPYSAASTVLLVINPNQGAVIGKGMWRFIGTLIGMLAAFALMAAAGQMPLLFILGFGAWLGLCVAGMTVLRHFRASGVVVAGYTIGLATYGAMGHPERTFEHVMARGSTVAVGVACLTLVAALLSRRGVRARLEAAYAGLAARVARAIAAPDGERVRQGLVGEIYGVDDLLALGKAESDELARRAAAVRNGMAALFGALVGVGETLPPGAAAQALATLREPLARAWNEAARALEAGAAGAFAARRILEDARGACAAAIPLPDAQAEADLLIGADRLLEQIDAYLDALAGLQALARPSAGASGGVAPVRFHRDYGGALRNGLRSMLAIVLAGLFWLGTGWPHGDMMLLVLAPYCALLATAPDPVAGARAFVRGTLWAVPAAAFCAFGVLPLIDGFPLLVLVLAAFWLPGVYATGAPATALAGLAYLVAFNTLTAASNPMHYGLPAFLNYAAAWVLATIFALLAFRLILPRDPAREFARLRATVRDEALALLRGGHARPEAWQQRQQHRVAQLGALLKSRPALLSEALAQSLAAMHLGREVLRIRRALRRRELPDGAQHAAMQGLERLARQPGPPSRAAVHAKRTARLLACHADAALPQRAQVQKVMAAFADIHALARGHAAYFDAETSREPEAC